MGSGHRRRTLVDVPCRPAYPVKICTLGRPDPPHRLPSGPFPFRQDQLITPSSRTEGAREDDTHIASGRGWTRAPRVFGRVLASPRVRGPYSLSRRRTLLLFFALSSERERGDGNATRMMRLFFITVPSTYSPLSAGRPELDKRRVSLRGRQMRMAGGPPPRRTNARTLLIQMPHVWLSSWCLCHGPPKTHIRRTKSPYASRLRHRPQRLKKWPGMGLHLGTKEHGRWTTR